MHHPSLHDEEVRVVDVQFDGKEKVADLLGCLSLSIDVALDFIILNRPRHRDRVTFLIVWRRKLLLPIVKLNRHAGLGDARVAALVDQVLHLGGANLGHLADAHNKADGVEDVTLARTIESRDSIELRIEPADVRAH